MTNLRHGNESNEPPIDYDDLARAVPAPHGAGIEDREQYRRDLDRGEVVDYDALAADPATGVFPDPAELAGALPSRWRDGVDYDALARDN